VAERAALVIALLGAESTGKTALAPLLADAIADLAGVRTAWVPEHLRAWCDERGRTPRADEQAAIAATQAAAIEHAARAHEVVVCDTTPLATAVYSRLLFGDDALVAQAVAWQRRCAVTLLTALDLPWVADGHQRDGPHVREPVDDALRQLLAAHRLPWALVSGHGAARLDSALDAVAPLLRGAVAPRDGLFTRLASRNADVSARAWRCERCDDPECERRLRAGR
jgi:nicotinamide riboside kinase